MSAAYESYLVQKLKPEKRVVLRPMRDSPVCLGGNEASRGRSLFRILSLFPELDLSHSAK